MSWCHAVGRAPGPAYVAVCEMRTVRSWSSAVLVLATVGHLAYRASAAQNRPLEVSSRETPFALEGLMAEALVEPSPSLDESCQVLVFFRASCPACQEAARIEAALAEPHGVAVTWIGESEPEAEAFAGRVHPSSAVAWSSSLFGSFGVQGVPAAFLIRQSEVTEVWRYRGSEGASGLSQRCSVMGADKAD